MMKKNNGAQTGNVFLGELWTNKTGLFSLFLLLIVLPLVYSEKTVDPVIFPRLLFLSVFLLIIILIHYKTSMLFH